MFLEYTFPMKDRTITLDVESLTVEQLESIKNMAIDIYENGPHDEDIFKATISATMEWLKLALHDEQVH